MRYHLILIVVIISIISTIACGSTAPTALAPIPTLEHSPFENGGTLYGFFPSPPEATYESILDIYKTLGEHGDVVLLQQAVDWEHFAQSGDGEYQSITDIHNQHILAHQNNLEVIFVVDPLNGLNRREFYNLPSGWEPDFGNPQVRAAFTNYTLRVVREFHPRYLGLASEINTYADAHPDDFANYLSLYQNVYDSVKAEAPGTQVFVTFQWEDLNNLIAGADEGRQRFETNWDQVEAFEPKLDLWVISSYPFVAFKQAADIPADYYTPLLTRTSKPLAVAEGGFISKEVGPLQGSPQDQVDYLQALQTQLGKRLSFWIYLLARDFNIESYAKLMKEQGNEEDIPTLNLFTTVGLSEYDGTPKPALQIWDNFHQNP